MQPPTDSGVSSIITPLSLWDLCLNEAASSLMPFPFILAADEERINGGNTHDVTSIYSNSLPLFQSV